MSNQRELLQLHSQKFHENVNSFMHEGVRFNTEIRLHMKFSLTFYKTHHNFYQIFVVMLLPTNFLSVFDHSCGTIVLVSLLLTLNRFRTLFWCFIVELEKYCWSKYLHVFLSNTRSSSPEIFCNKGVLKNLPKFTGELQTNNFINKETSIHVCSCELCETFLVGG